MIANRYKIIDKINKGTFGTIIQAENIRTKEKVAIKIEFKDSDIKTLKNEAKIYQYLGKEDGYAQLKWYGTNEKFNYLVIDLLGCSLKKIINYYKVLSLKTVLILGIQLIQRLQTLHNKDLLHRDIKPDNFLLGNGNTTNKIYLIDFGFCKKYIDHGKHIPQTNISNIIGTTNFVSLNVHKHIEPSRRDDIESCIYIITYMFLGHLEWIQTTDTKNVVKLKEQLTNVPDLPPFIKIMLQYVRELKFDDKPDYDYIIQLMQDVFIQNKFKNNNKFEWT